MLHLPGRAEQADLAHARLPGGHAGVVSAFTINEIGDAVRARLIHRYLEQARRGVRILVVEPIAQRVTPWGPEWREAFEAAAGWGGEWRFEVDLPDLVRRLDRAAGLDHRELTAKSLWL